MYTELVSQSLKAYEQLRDEIVAWDLAPGAHLNEVRLAERLGVSRTPLREAIQRLARENLVRITPGRGAFVTEVALSDVRHLFQMREALETYAVKMCARAHDRSRFVRLHTEFGDGDPEELIARLEELIDEAAGNPYLGEALGSLRGQLRRLQLAARRSPERLGVTMREYGVICQAIADGEEDRAALAMSFHIHNSLRALTDVLWAN